MPGHDQTDVRRSRRRAPLGRGRALIAPALAFALLVAPAAFSRPAPADAPRAEASWKGEPADSVLLSADQIQTWESAGVHWALLEDHARLSQGDVSIAAKRMVIQVSRSADGNLLRVYAEEDVRDPAQPSRAYPQVRTTVATSADVRLEPRPGGGRRALKSPPVGLPIVARAFPRSTPNVIAMQSPEADPAEPRDLPDLPTAPRPMPEGSGPVVPTIDVKPAEAGASATPFGSSSASSVAGSPAPDAAPVADGDVRRTQVVVDGPGFPDDLAAPPRVDPLPDLDALPLAPNGLPIGPGADAPVVDSPTTLLPLPDGTPRTLDEPNAPAASGDSRDRVVVPGSQQLIDIQPRIGTEIEALPSVDGVQIFAIRNGVNILTRTAQQGSIDLEADNVIIWIRSDKTRPAKLDINNRIVVGSNQAIEFYLEGNVIFRQDQLKIQGDSDKRTYQAERAYYDVQKDQLLVLNAQVDLFAPNLITPIKVKAPRIFQFHPQVTAPDGQPAFSTLAQIQADRTVTTGSRFANPGYRFTSKSLDISQVVDTQAVPSDTGNPFDKDDLTWQIDSRQNFFYFGRVPVFYWPRFFVEADDINPPLQGLTFSTNNYFGQQIRADFDLFNIFNIRHAPEIDVWNLDLDYLSARDKRPGQGIALGNELGWFGQDLINDIKDPFHRNKDYKFSGLGNYAGYLDLYGLFDGSRDVLGPGPAIITNAPNNNAAGRAGFSRISNPTFQEFRGRVTARHMQSLLDRTAPLDEDFRINAEIGFFSDRNFLEQYFKRLFDTGLDQENLLYLIKQQQNNAVTLQAEVNLQQFQTESQWLPKLDYYRLGDSLLGNRLTHFQHTGVDYANVHTANEVNNRTIFSFLPYDPISNTNGTFQSGRLFTSHELDAPLNFGFLRVTPYLQGQLEGWNNQIFGHAVGRYWGAAGARADVTFWKAYTDVDSEILNVHGLNHKIDLVADFRDAYSNVSLNSIGIQDDLDDNAYEYTRRYFALTTYNGGLLPAQYDPRFLILRRALSPITGTTDVQASIETLKLGIHQRLQTKRGQEGKRHINDYMVFDVDTTYFPNAARDNFNKPFGQNFYNYEWYLGDRTSIVSYGWFEFFKIGGSPLYTVNNKLRNDPFGLHIVTSGLSITRIPKGNIFIGYTIVNTGPISTSALNAAYSYWMSPKWFGTAGTSYDFGNDVLLAATGSLTRIGADYLTSVGLTVSPLQHSYQFVFEISPRLSPNLRAGSAQGLTRLDSRFAPVE